MLISDVHDIGVTLGAGGSSSYSNAFNLTSAGVPDSQKVNWATVSFTLLDTDGNSDMVSATLGGDTLYGGSSPFLFSAFGGLVSASVVSTLNLSGILNYTLTYMAGASSVYVGRGALVADVTSVPEPGTLSLLGAGLFAGWLSTRRRKHTPNLAA